MKVIKKYYFGLLLKWCTYYSEGCFEDENVSHVEGDINPVRDIEIINEELRLKDEEYLLNIIDKMERTVLRGSDKKAKPEYVRILILSI